MKRPLLILLPLLLSTAVASAQPTFRLGVRGGINRATSTLAAASNSTTSYPFSYSATKSAIHAWQAGAVLEVAFRHFSLQPALIFSQKGEQLSTYTVTYYSRYSRGIGSEETCATSRPNWLEVPVNVVYTLHGFQVFAGPYVALAVGGRKRGTSLSTSPYAKYGPSDFDEKIAFGSKSANRRLDAGINFGLGYQRGPLQLQLGYGLGLRNMHQPPEINYIIIDYSDGHHDFSADAAYARVMQLTGTYFFKL
ncbi:MAG: hypothetical protein JWP58_2408 [Hymenobacter sp.]|nr:hypothetical protein [Hymenobacter sp.]